MHDRVSTAWNVKNYGCVLCLSRLAQQTMGCAVMLVSLFLLSLCAVSSSEANSPLMHTTETTRQINLLRRGDYSRGGAGPRFCCFDHSLCLSASLKAVRPSANEANEGIAQNYLC